MRGIRRLLRGGSGERPGQDPPERKKRWRIVIVVASGAGFGAAVAFAGSVEAGLFAAAAAIGAALVALIAGSRW